MNRLTIWLRRVLFVGVSVIVTANLADASVYDRNGKRLPDTEAESTNVDWNLLSIARDKKYNSIGLLDSEDGDCTVFFIESLPQSVSAQGRLASTQLLSPKTTPAYALTNGHCYDIPKFPGVNEVIVNHPSNQAVILNWFFDSKQDQLYIVNVRKVAYATMKGTDVAILELDTTYQQLIDAGFKPLTIAPNPVAVGEPVEMIGVPGISPSFLHRTLCQTGESVNTLENGYGWEGSIRHRCSAISGMSGSPVISLRTNQVVAIHNTSVKDDALAQSECSDNRPCEVSATGKTATFPSENYAQRISDIPACFDQDGVFNLQLSSCRLPKP
ncbi:MAG: serine protease [Cyanobacteriota bacterium]|nr:serine protease [Cyanobacteriota bacterium]